MSIPEYRHTAFGMSNSFPGHSQRVPECCRGKHSECLRASQIIPKASQTGPPTAFELSQSVPGQSQSITECCRTAFGLFQSFPEQSQSVPECRRKAFGLSQSFPRHSQRPQKAVIQHSECVRASQGTPRASENVVVQHLPGHAHSFPECCRTAFGLSQNPPRHS